MCYYRWKESTNQTLVCKREYFSTIKQVVINDKWTAVLSDGCVTLHIIEAEMYGGNSDDRKFPANDSDKSIAHIHLTDQFLIMVDTSGNLRYYLIEENQVISEFSPENPIEKVFPNRTGTK